jgi:hypothetical protein
VEEIQAFEVREGVHVVLRPLRGGAGARRCPRTSQQASSPGAGAERRAVQLQGERHHQLQAAQLEVQVRRRHP